MTNSSSRRKAPLAWERVCYYLCPHLAHGFDFHFVSESGVVGLRESMGFADEPAMRGVTWLLQVNPLPLPSFAL